MLQKSTKKEAKSSFFLEELNTYKRDLKKIVGYFEEDELELSNEIKKRIMESRKRPLSRMIPQEEVEKEFL